MLPNILLQSQKTICVTKIYYLQLDVIWSVSIYGLDQNFVDNPINKYAIGDCSKDLKVNEEDSFYIYVSKSISN